MGKRKYTAMAQCPLCKVGGLFLAMDTCPLCKNSRVIEVGLTKAQYKKLKESENSYQSIGTVTYAARGSITEGQVVYQTDVTPTIGDILDGQEGE